MSVSLRRLKAGDEQVVGEIVSRFKSRHVSPESAARFVADARHYVFVAEAGGEIAGFLLAYRLERLDGDAPQLFVYELEVAPRHRRRGVGTLLIARVREVVQHEAMREAFVITDHDNVGAVALYRKSGGYAESESSIVFVYPGRRAWGEAGPGCNVFAGSDPMLGSGDCAARVAAPSLIPASATRKDP